MTKYVAVAHDGQRRPTGISEKYVKQTYDALSHVDINLENIAIQISQLPVREQKKFFRLLINYIDITASQSKYTYGPVALKSIIELCNRLIDVVNDYMYELEDNQLALF